MILAFGIVLPVSAVEAEPFAYVVQGGRNIVVIDTATGQVVKSLLDIGPIVSAIAVAPNGKRAYVGTQTYQLAVVATKTNKVIAEVRFDQWVRSIAFMPDGKRAYITTHRRNLYGILHLFDTTMNRVITSISVVGGAVLVALSPDGKRAYVVSTKGSAEVQVIDTDDNKPMADPIPISQVPSAISITPDGKLLYVASYDSRSGGILWAIDTTLNRVVAEIPLGYGLSPNGLAVSPDGLHVYATNGRASHVIVVSTTTQSVVDRIPVGPRAAGIAFAPDGRHAYVANSGGNSLSVIDTVKRKVVGLPIRIGAGPSSVAMIPPLPSRFFPTFGARLGIGSFGSPQQADIGLHTDFTVEAAATFDPSEEPVTVQAGTFITTIPAGSFTKLPEGPYAFDGMIDGVSLHARLAATGTRRYAFSLVAKDADVTGTRNPAPVALQIGNDRGGISVTPGIRP